MAITTQYNPQRELNAQLLAAGASKTVFALVTPETEDAKRRVFGEGNFLASVDQKKRRSEFMSQFREAWTGKQDALHRDFFDEWHAWSSPVVDLDRADYPYCYPTAGASEPLRHLIFAHATKGGRAVHVFEGEYEGYRSMAEAAGLKVIEHPRTAWADVSDPDRDADDPRHFLPGRDLFFISQPSAIDGNDWSDFNDFITLMPLNSVVADVTYVGAVPKSAVPQRIDLNYKSIVAVVFSLSKPFGAYYDRIGGVFCREEDEGLFGNMWFKSLTALSIGRELMQTFNVFDLPELFRGEQEVMTARVSEALGFALTPCDVYILAGGVDDRDEPLPNYLRRAGRLRVCLTPGMADLVGTTGDYQ